MEPLGPEPRRLGLFASYTSIYTSSSITLYARRCRTRVMLKELNRADCNITPVTQLRVDEAKGVLNSPSANESEASIRSCRKESLAPRRAFRQVEIIFLFNNDQPLTSAQTLSV